MNKVEKQTLLKTKAEAFSFCFTFDRYLNISMLHQVAQSDGKKKQEVEEGFLTTGSHENELPFLASTCKFPLGYRIITLQVLGIRIMQKYNMNKENKAKHKRDMT